MKQQQTFYALGSDVTLTIVHDHSASYGEQLFKTLRQSITEFEQRFSRFLPESELTHFNQQAGKHVPISTAFKALMAAAKTMARATDGLYNPFILPALQVNGYMGSWPHPEVHDSATDFSMRKFAKPENIIIRTDWASIPADTAIDFGGIGKGYLLDQLAAIADGEILNGYWFSVGGDIICAGYDDSDVCWRIGIQRRRACRSDH